MYIYMHICMRAWLGLFCFLNRTWDGSVLWLALALFQLDTEMNESWKPRRQTDRQPWKKGTGDGKIIHILFFAFFFGRMFPPYRCNFVFCMHAFLCVADMGLAAGLPKGARDDYNVVINQVLFVFGFVPMILRLVFSTWKVENCMVNRVYLI